LPVLIKSVILPALFVKLAFAPKAMVIATSTALLPPIVQMLGKYVHCSGCHRI